MKLVLFVVALAGCKPADSTPKQETPKVASETPPKVVKPAPVAPKARRMLGAFDMDAKSYDLKAMFPDQQIELAPTSATVLAADGSRYASLQLEADKVTRLVVHAAQPFADFSGAHPDATCLRVRGEVMCNTDELPYVSFVLDESADAPRGAPSPIANVAGSRVVRIEWEPVTARPAIVRLPKYPPDVVERCARLRAVISECGYGYDAEYGFSKSGGKRSTYAEAHLACNVDKEEEGQQPTLPAPSKLEEHVVAAVEAARKTSCKALAAELGKHYPVHDRAPWN